MSNEHKHIVDKDKGDDVSKILGDMLQDTSDKLLKLSFDKILTNTEKNEHDWYKNQMSSLNSFKQKVNAMAKEEKNRIIKATKQGSKVLNLSQKQTDTIQKEIESGIQGLKSSVVSTHVKNISEIKNTAQVTKILKSGVVENLYNTIKDKIEKTQNYGIVAYKNGRGVRWENYMEMKVRTDIQKDITENMIQEGHELGNIFYIAAYFGDCAMDHVEAQGRIYIDENWEEKAPKNRLEEIAAYVSTNDIQTVQSIVKGPTYFTTRPNCRHYFQMISIDEVLGIKTEKELNAKREEFGLNFNGKYKPEKYKALTEQRYNERNIRHWKGQLEADQKLLDKMPSSISENERLLLKSRILLDKRKIRYFQSKQRDLIKANPGVLERNYNREIYNRMRSDLGVSRELKNLKDQINQEEEKVFITDENQMFFHLKTISREKIKNIYGSGNIKYDYSDFVGEYNKKIVLTKERKNHILERHPEMEKYISNLIEYINNPSDIISDREFNDTKNIIYNLNLKHQIFITIKFAPKKEKVFSSIISARYQHNKKKKR